MKTLKPVRIPSMVLHPEDLAELLPRATQEEMETIADGLADSFMVGWQEALEYAVDLIKQDRRRR